MSKFRDTNFAGKKALIRVDFNVPLDAAFHITDDSRIKAAIPTIKKILDDGGSVILMSHLGRPKDGPSDKYSLKHIVNHLSSLLGTQVQFAADCIGEEAVEKAKALQPGQVLLLENLRFYKEEEKGDQAFAKKLAGLGDIYINDAFGTAHRAHASTAVIAQFFPTENKMFGLVMEGEVASAEKVLHSAEKPFTAIIGGAKVSDKILIIENLLDRATDIIIGGGMAYTFYKAMGGQIGASLCEQDRLDTAKELMGFLLPAGTLEYFDLTHIVKDKEGLVLFLEEKNIPPAEYAGQTLHSKGFYPEVRVQDFPIRDNKVELSIKRRRWEVQSSGEIVSRNWDLVMKGARLTKEFALFLKDTFGQSSD